MAKRGPLRIRLTKTHSIPEIEQMMRDIESDPDSKAGAVSPNVYSKSVDKKLDEMSWAIYSLRKKESGAHVSQASAPEMKWW